MKFLVLGSGGREHAIAAKLAESKVCEIVYIAPGNGGTEYEGKNVDIDISDFDEIGQFALEEDIDFIVVGPEIPLVNGIEDYFHDNEILKDIHIIGPSKNGAMLEGSKKFAKEFMKKHNIPTANYNEFSKINLQEGINFIEKNNPPFVLKADGLAAGKGVVIAQSKDEAKLELTEMIAESKFGESSATVLIEEFLDGIEFSVFALTDGKNYVLLPNAKDYKRIGEGDKGLNTGGMGAISPVPFIDDNLMKKVSKEIIKPTINGLIEDKIRYKGFIYFGLILVNNEPKVIEYNCRLGDPETEVILPRLESDFGKLMIHCSEGTLDKVTIKHSENVGATVVLVSGGYPEKYEKGIEITLLNRDEISEAEFKKIFHAGTKISQGKLYTNGGRVLAVTSLEKNLEMAVQKSIEKAENIEFKGKYYRKDIGYEFLS